MSRCDSSHLELFLQRVQCLEESFEPQKGNTALEYVWEAKHHRSRFVKLDGCAIFDSFKILEWYPIRQASDQKSPLRPVCQCKAMIMTSSRKLMPRCLAFLICL